MSLCASFVNLSVLLAAPYVLGTSMAKQPLQAMATAVAAVLSCWILCGLVCKRCGAGQEKACTPGESVMKLFEAVVLVAISTPVMYMAAIFFGVPVMRHTELTGMWAVWLSTMIVVPAMSALGRVSQWNSRFADAQFRASGVACQLAVSLPALLVGNWMACVSLPMDDLAAWQHWPVPNVVCGSICFFAASLIMAVFTCARRAWCGGSCSAAMSSATIVDVASSSRRGKSPAKRGKSPAKRSKSPAKKSKSPAKKSTSPAKRTSSAKKTTASKRSESPAPRSSTPTRASRTKAAAQVPLPPSTSKKSTSAAKKTNSRSSSTSRTATPTRRASSSTRRGTSRSPRTRSSSRK